MADMSGAILRNAELHLASLIDADLEGATWIDGRICQEGSIGGCNF